MDSLNPSSHKMNIKLKNCKVPCGLYGFNCMLHNIIMFCYKIFLQTIKNILTTNKDRIN